jgi:hypothetical protein
MQGSQGVQGIAGAGSQGIQGITGSQGVQGIAGAGSQGIQGITGSQGVQGTTGAGSQGIQGITGSQGVQGSQGIQGTTGAGSQGIQGITGSQGVQGTQGIQGTTGAGSQGIQGITGSQGVQGITGTGNQGTQGIQGITGSQGVQGITGSQGVQGTQGIQGTTGAGSQGIQGITGSQGVQGVASGFTNTTIDSIFVNNATVSNSTSTGALIVSGGAGIGGNLNVGGDVVANRLVIQLTTITTTLVQTDDIIQTLNTTNATSTVTGAIQIAGGAGIGRDLYVGGTIYGNVNGVTSTASSVNTLLQTSNATYYPTFVDANNSSSAAELLYTTSSVVINPSTGNVGIGTSSPTNKLVVSNAGAQGFEFDPATGIMQIYNRNTSAYGELRPYGSLIRFFTGTSPMETMRLDSSGNLLIGTTSNGADGLGIGPTLNLTFPEGSGASYANLFRQQSSAATILANGYKRSVNANAFASSIGTSWAKTAVALNDGAILFYTDSAATVANGTDVTPTERMRIDSSGNLGIGVTPSAWSTSRKAIQLPDSGYFGTQGGTLFLTANVYADSSLTSRYVADGFANRFRITSGEYQWFNAPSGTAGNTISFTQAMTLDASGNLLVGTTSSLGGNGAYGVFGNSAASGANRWAAYFGTNSASASAAPSFGLTVGWNYSGGGESNIVYGVGSGTAPALAFSSSNGTTVTERFRITSTGGITSSDLADAVGYKGTPLNEQSAAYTLVIGDQGKSIVHPISDNNARTFTIPANSSVAFPVGTAITFVNMINTLTIAILTDTMYLAGEGTTGTRTLSAFGMASAIKMTTSTWIISGNGLI